jgi:hypothetical protein
MYHRTRLGHSLKITVFEGDHARVRKGAGVAEGETVVLRKD